MAYEKKPNITGKDLILYIKQPTGGPLNTAHFDVIHQNPVGNSGHLDLKKTSALVK